MREIPLENQMCLTSWVPALEPLLSPGSSVELHSWLALCAESSPPADSWLVELEDGYRYRYWIIDINVTVEFIAVTYERWMLIKKID